MDEMLVDYSEKTLTMNPMNYHMSEVCDFLQTYSVLLFSVMASIVSVFLFYKTKLKAPIQELKDVSKMITDNVDFQISYKNDDEMGMLCDGFETMRRSLADNNQTMWRMLDDEKALQAAIAHDIRSPLAILRGYQEMLMEFLPIGSLETEDIMDILQTGMAQIDRMEHFTENMRKMSNLEQRELEYSTSNLSELAKKIQVEADMLSKNTDKICQIKISQEQLVVKIDEELVLEVLDNLLENAIRYAKRNIEIQIQKIDELLIISVEDDGVGFSYRLLEYADFQRRCLSNEATFYHGAVSGQIF